LPLNQKPETTGRKCTKCGKSEPDVNFTLKQNTWGKWYSRPMCNSCYNVLKESQRKAVFKEFGRGKTHILIQENRPPLGTPCKICSTPMTHGRGSDSVNFDHDPVSHTFRGWICKKCNTSLGGFGDSLEGLLKAVNYLTPNETTD